MNLLKDLIFFDEIGNKHHKRIGYKPRFSNKINTKSAMLEYLKIIENKLVDMFSTPSIIKKNKQCQSQRLCA